jgi:hypothetical protein
MYQVDTSGLFGFILTTSGAIGAADNPRATTGAVIEVSSWVIIGTDSGSFAVGGVTSIGEGRNMSGALAGVGPSVGVVFGDISSIAGAGTSQSLVLGPISLSLSRDSNGIPTSAAASLVGKGAGLAIFTTQTQSTVSTLNVGSNGVSACSSR